jgi:putative glutamine amidotransferase
MSKMKKPIIGIVLDHETRKEKDGGYSNYPWYALRADYSKAVVNNGGIPIMIPYHAELIDQYLSFCEGFIFPGGEYDISPSYYGEKPDPKTSASSDARTNFEIELMRKVLKKNKPLLGICAGEQLLNVVLGGTLYQDISSCINTKINHKPGGETSQNRHFIDIKENSLLHKIVGKDRYKVNSHHHQAVHKLGEGLVISAKSEDGIIEAIERPQSHFCIGVEWHPEYEKNAEDSKLIKALIKHSI